MYKFLCIEKLKKIKHLETRLFFFVVCFVFTQITFQTGTKSTILVKNSFLLFFSLFLLAKEDTFIVLFTHTHTTTIKMNSQQTLDGMEKKKRKKNDTTIKFPQGYNGILQAVRRDRIGKTGVRMPRVFLIDFYLQKQSFILSAGID